MGAAIKNEKNIWAWSASVKIIVVKTPTKNEMSIFFIVFFISFVPVFP